MQRTDRREDKWRLPVEEAVIDAHLHVVEGTHRNVFSKPPRQPRDLPLPRITGYIEKDGDKSGKLIAVVSGEHLRWLLERKRGFSRTEQYLTGLIHSFGRTPDTLRIQVWDLAEELPHLLIDKMERRIGFPLERFGPSKKKQIVDAIGRKVFDQEQAWDNWFLEAWFFLSECGVVAGTRPSGKPRPTHKQNEREKPRSASRRPDKNRGGATSHRRSQHTGLWQTTQRPEPAAQVTRMETREIALKEPGAGQTATGTTHTQSVL